MRITSVSGMLHLMRILTKFLIALLLLILLNSQTYAGDIEPRTYVNTPVGINFIIAAYAHSEGGLSFPAAVPIDDAKLKIGTSILAYARSLDVLGKSGKIDFILPYSELSGSALVGGQPRERDISGPHDPRFRFSVNFYGAPALSMKEFSNYQQDLLIGASVQVSAPAGQYDSSKLINLGNNRWFIKPDIGISKAFGPLTLELTGAVTIFSDNDDYFGGKTLEQAPLYTTQLNANYSFNNGAWFALGAVYDYGGRTTIDGIRSDNVQSNSRFGATLALPVNRNNSIKLNASTGVSTRTGSDYNLYGVAWQYRWGNDL